MKPRRFAQSERMLAIILSILLLYILPTANSSQASEGGLNIYSAQPIELAQLKQGYFKATPDWEYVLENYVDEAGRTDFRG